MNMAQNKDYKITIEHTIEQLLSIPKYGNGIGLHRFYVLAEMWDIDLSFFEPRTIHVTGSNGKGSVSTFAGNLLQGAGLTVGLFTSPHLLRFNERICINDGEISDQELMALSDAAINIKARYEMEHPGDTVGAFELFTLIAAKYFYKNKPDVLVIEAGIGGRFDTTKCFGGRVGALVSLDYEHTALLGNTLEEIGYDKSDIVNSNSILILGEIPPKISNKIEAYNRSKNTRTLLFGKDFTVTTLKSKKSIKKLCVDCFGYRVEGQLGLAGAFQEHNTGVAIAVSLAWLIQNHNNRVGDYIKNAGNSLLKSKCHGRLEQISSCPNITIDVGHSPAAVTSALDAYGELNGVHISSNDYGILVTGVSRDKSIEDILKILSPKFSYIICTRAYHRGADPDIIAAQVRHQNQMATVTIMHTIEEAVKHSIDISGTYNKPVYVAGGLFLAIEYWQAFLKEMLPDKIVFF